MLLYPKLYWICGYLFMLGLKLIHVSKLRLKVVVILLCRGECALYPLYPLSCIFNTMAVDPLTTLGARASTPITVTRLCENIPVSAQEEFRSAK